jgi:GNAT superfamily N-acetyltransferase
MEANKSNYIISTDKSKINIELVHDYLCHHSYWAEGISLEIVKRSIEHSLCFGIYSNYSQQVGFARVISDFATYAYLADLFVIPVERGNGLSKWLIQFILAHPQLQGLRKFALATQDAHGLYRQFGFTPYPNPDRIMVISNPDIYKKGK